MGFDTKKIEQFKKMIPCGYNFFFKILNFLIKLFWILHLLFIFYFSHKLLDPSAAESFSSPS